MKATHNGTCQVCGRQQASKSNGLAKHGYTTTWGYFSGVCHGAHSDPVEISTDLLDKTVAQLIDHAAILNAITAETLDRFEISFTVYDRGAFDKGTKVSKTFTSEADWEAWKRTDEGSRAGYSLHGHTWASQIDRAVAEQHRTAGQMLQHVEMLKQLKADRHGKPLYKRENPAQAPDRCPGSGQFPDTSDGARRIYRPCPTCGVGFKVTRAGKIAGHKKPK